MNSVRVQARKDADIFEGNCSGEGVLHRRFQTRECNTNQALMEDQWRTLGVLDEGRSKVATTFATGVEGFLEIRDSVKVLCPTPVLLRVS